MANVTLDVKIIIRNDLASELTLNNPVLLRGEMCIESDTGKFKFGDGVTAWNDLEYASGSSAQVSTEQPPASSEGYDIGTLWVHSTDNRAYILTSTDTWKSIATLDDLADLGSGDMLKSVFATNPKVGQGYVDKAIQADEAAQSVKLKTARTIQISGDASGNALFDGSENADINIVLKNSGATAGTYTKLTINSKGIVTAAESITASDIPSLTLSKITDAGTAAGKDVGTSSGNIPVLDLDGKLDESILPAIAITEVFSVNSQADMLALVAQTGGVAVRTDINKSFILSQSPASTLANWIELRTPTDSVLSVNNKTGAVTLTTSDISEGSNLYFTNSRFDDRFGTKSYSDLSDGGNLMNKNDTFILNGGGA